MSESAAASRQVTLSKQPWLRSSSWDLSFIIGPAFLTAFIALALKPQIDGMKDLPLWFWVCFVLLVDVAHVYASLFRTYFNKKAREQHGTLLGMVPFSCWGIGALLYSMSAVWFWRVLAYLAVFHFIRQQYGFMSLYSRKDDERQIKYRWLDESCIYLATLYPLAFWHNNLPRNFNWFVEGDFIENLPHFVSAVLLILYVVFALAYLVKEIVLLRQGLSFNLPRNLLLLGTAFGWWVAIVAIDSDLSFTMVNVISHGVPYMALIWLYHRVSPGKYGKVEELPEPGFERAASFLEKFVAVCLSYLPVFLAVLLLFAYLEEGFWDGLIWREHLRFFSPFQYLPQITDKGVLAILIPLLALPQSTHYVLDGFIWRVKDQKSSWSA